MGPTMWHADMPDASWDDIQQRLSAHFLQSRAWLAFHKRRGNAIFYAYGDGWSWAAILEEAATGRRLYCPYGPTARSKDALRAALQALTSCARQQQVDYIRVEPQGDLTVDDLKSLGLRHAHRTIQPRYTLVKNLQPDEDTLLAEMTATNRNLYRTAAKKGITFRASNNPKEITILLDMLHEVAKNNNITIHSDVYFTTMAEVLLPLGAAKLFIAEINAQPVAASFVFDSPTTRYYAHAASKASARKLHPGTPLVAHMIFDAKASGKTSFDFNGVAPPDQPHHPWTGFTQFKKSFGGEIKDMHGTWELPIKKLRYHVYRLVRSLRK